MIQIMAFIAATMSPPTFMNNPTKGEGFVSVTRRNVGRYSLETILEKPICTCSLAKYQELFYITLRDGRSVHVTISNGDKRRELFKDADFLIQCVGKK